jgi:hypothetical protein
MFSPDFDKDRKLTPESILPTLRGSILQMELRENIITTLRSIYSEAQRQNIPESGKPLGRIRIFCQKKMLEKELNGGYGYFVLDRSRDSSNPDGTQHDYWIDFFLYEEGE